MVKKGIVAAKEIILAETNLKDLKFIENDSEMLSKRAKPNFKLLGPKYGNKIKEVGQVINSLDSKQINELEKNGTLVLTNGENISKEDVEI